MMDRGVKRMGKKAGEGDCEKQTCTHMQHNGEVEK